MTNYTRKSTRREVADTLELQRVLNLPRRVPTERDAVAWARVLTDELRAPGSREHLRMWQGYALATIAENEGGFIVLPVGFGKAQPDTEPVLTPDGWRPIGSLRAGMRVYGSQGKPVRVRAVFPQGRRPLMRMVFSDGTDALCDESHLWTFEADDRKSSTRTALEWSKARLSRPCGQHVAKIWWLPKLSPIEHGETTLPLDPYTLGALLGDGCFRGTPGFTSMDRDIVAALKLPPARNPLVAVLESLGLRNATSHTKFIPRQYLLAGARQRLEILRGLLDTDGAVALSGVIEYSSVSAALADGVEELARSLGGVVTRSKCSRAHRLSIRMPRDVQPFACTRKAKSYAAAVRVRQREPRRALVRVERAGFAKCTCISVEADDQLYVTRNYVLTHNTLIMWLACTMLGAERPLVVVPGQALVEKTLDDFASYRGKWKTPSPPPRVITKESLQVESGADLLDEFAPDLILIDEGDEMANAKRGAPKRLDRYRVANPLEFDEQGNRISGARYVVLTGTPARDSLMQVWHLLCWCLLERAPVPLDYHEARVWASALDAEGGDGRAHWGALEQLLPDGPERDGATLDSVRKAFQRRLAETPGVLIIDGDSCDQPLFIDVRLAREDPAIDAHYQAFLEKQTSPGDIPVADTLSRFRLDSQLGSGYYSVQFDPAKRELVHAYMRTGATAGFSELELDLLACAIAGRPERLIAVDTQAEWEIAPAAVRGLTNEEISAGVRRQPFEVTARAMSEAKAVLGATAPVSDAVYVQCYELCRPPIMWRVARRNCAAFVRDVIDGSDELDTEAQVYRRHPHNELVLAWLDWKARFEPESIVLWLSASAVQSCVDWLGESPDPGIVWCGGVEFAHALAAATNLPYYGAQGVDKRSGRTLHRADPTRSMIVSWNANKKGFNLQPWARQLVAQPPPSAKWIEQIIGRSHRSLQDKPVRVTLLATSGGILDGFEATLAEAAFGKDMFGPTQKVLRATITRATLRSTATNEYRWATRS